MQACSTHLVANKQKPKTCMKSISMRMKRQFFLCTQCSLTHLCSTITVYQRQQPDRKGSVSLTPVGVMWEFSVFTSTCIISAHVCQNMCFFCAIWIICWKKLCFEALGQNPFALAPAPFFLSPAGPDLPCYKPLSVSDLLLLLKNNCSTHKDQKHAFIPIVQSRSFVTAKMTHRSLFMKLSGLWLRLCVVLVDWNYKVKVMQRFTVIGLLKQCHCVSWAKANQAWKLHNSVFLEAAK